jgi:hypothetical protein
MCAVLNREYLERRLGKTSWKMELDVNSDGKATNMEVSGKTVTENGGKGAKQWGNNSATAHKDDKGMGDVQFREESGWRISLSSRRLEHYERISATYRDTSKMCILFDARVRFRNSLHVVGGFQVFVSLRMKRTAHMLKPYQDFDAGATVRAKRERTHSHPGHRSQPG